nr:hypothetical protein [uncultured Devosia sp.]
MQRSRTQLATSYAPGALFTYEGGLGCCGAIPLPAVFSSQHANLEVQLFEHLKEFVTSWFERATAARPAPAVLPEQALDPVFLDYTDQPNVDPSRFQLTKPDRIGFMPDPLVFCCSECGLLSEFDNVDQLDRLWDRTKARTDCNTQTRHKWRQVDVVFAHWSGNYQGLSPYRLIMDREGKIEKVRRCSNNCGGVEYRLVRNGSSFFSDWRFECTTCLSQKDVVQADRDSLALLKPLMDQGSGNLPKEWNMLPVSYRASSVHYVQTDNFILFKDNELTTLMSRTRRDDLVVRLQKLYDFPGTALDHDEVLRQLEANQKSAEITDYKRWLDLLATIPAAQRDLIQKQLTDMRERFEQQQLIVKPRDEAPCLRAQIEANLDWARRYNPIRLGLEHDALRREVVDRSGSTPSLPSISVTHPATRDIDPDDTIAGDTYRANIQSKLGRLGISEMALLRGLDTCQYSFGFTRVAATPTTMVKDLEMPVRLKAFERVDRSKNPIYVMEQKNEGFYVRLDEGRVIEWLGENGFAEDLPVPGGVKLGGMLIEQYTDFGRFLDAYKDRAHSKKVPRSIPSFVYMLLHTMAHHLTDVVVEHSGLEHGSIGEYIFPADLAFLIYRKGMTPDLGNLSAMWRNHGAHILERLLWDRTLMCDSGSLCDHRGGACPACIMAPEVACIAGNNLLSRACLIGGPAPSWDSIDLDLSGYLSFK